MSIPESILSNPKLRASVEAAIERANALTNSIQPGLLEAPSDDSRLLRAIPDDLLGNDTTEQVDALPQPYEVIEVEPEEVVSGAVSAAKWAKEQADKLRNPDLDPVKKAKEDSHAAGRAFAMMHSRR